MNTKWLVQDRNMTPGFIEDTMSMLNRLDLSYSGLWINKEGKIQGLANVLSPNSQYIIRSGTKIINAITDSNTLGDIIDLDSLTIEQIHFSNEILNNLKKGVFFDRKTFEFSHYESLGLPLLNSKVQYLSYQNQGDIKFAQPMFLKPNEDNKFFTGGIIPSGMSVQDFVINNHPMNYVEDQLLVVAPVQNIEAEYRFFIVDGEVVTHSGYRSMGIANFFRETPPGLLELAKEYASLYQPHEVFVMDLALTNGQYKIVEYNCLNGCALYASDSAKLFFTLNDYIENKNNKSPKIKI